VPVGRGDPTVATHLQIGEVARRAGVTIRTIRFYEEKGLLTAASATSGGIRLYTERDVNRLLFVRRLKILGLSIDQIKECLGTISDGSTRRVRVENTVELLTMQREKIDEQISALKGIRGEIDASLEKVRGCLRCTRASCPEQCTSRNLVL